MGAGCIHSDREVHCSAAVSDPCQAAAAAVVLHIDYVRSLAADTVVPGEVVVACRCRSPEAREVVAAMIGVEAGRNLGPGLDTRYPDARCPDTHCLGIRCRLRWSTATDRDLVGLGAVVDYPGHS